MWVKKWDNARFVVKTLRKFKISETKPANTYKNILYMAEYIVAYFAI